MLFRPFQKTEELRIKGFQVAVRGEEGRDTIDDRIKPLAGLTAIRLIYLPQRAPTLRTGKNLLPDI